MESIIDRFGEGVYNDDDSVSAFRNVGEALSSFGLEALVNETAAEYLEKRHGFSEKFVREIIQTASRANYGQDVESLHAFGALVIERMAMEEKINIGWFNAYHILICHNYLLLFFLYL